MTQPRRIHVTYALIYANGPVHLGHLLGYVQTDIWVRFQKLRGHQCEYICGSDTHGTPIMLRAEQKGVTPEEMVTSISAQQQQTFQRFHIGFTSFGQTDSPCNQQLVEQMYQTIHNKGEIVTKDVEQAFDTEKHMFLPDRYVRGTCPKCGAEDQYGDNCEVCGTTYDPTDLINPISTVSGKPPIRKTSTHYFFDLPQYQQTLTTWFAQADLQPGVKNKLGEWFKRGLQQWDISRDAPYYGFIIPGTTDKYFYVWLDAPIGYLASYQKYCDTTQGTLNDIWWQDSQVEVYHFIGKDIMYFHALFWPAVLASADYRLPTGVFAHGFLTINGQKMSKSRGTFITGDQYLEHLNPEYLRYYYAAKLSDGVDDIDLNWEDFRLRVNADLVGKVVNIASRCAGFLRKKFANHLAGELLDPSLFEHFANQDEIIADHYEKRQFSAAMREIIALADQANQFIEQHKPWELAKNDSNLPQIHLVCTQAINLFRTLMVYLKPVLPVIAENVEIFLNTEPLTWQDSQQPLLGHDINKFKPLMTRVEEAQLETLLH